jgi:hypothetical protein
MKKEVIITVRHSNDEQSKNKYHYHHHNESKLSIATTGKDLPREICF